MSNITIMEVTSLTGLRQCLRNMEEQRVTVSICTEAR